MPDATMSDSKPPVSTAVAPALDLLAVFAHAPDIHPRILSARVRIRDLIIDLKNIQDVVTDVVRAGASFHSPSSISLTLS